MCNQLTDERRDDEVISLWFAARDRLPAHQTLRARHDQLRQYVQKFWEHGSPLTADQIAWFGHVALLLPVAVVERVAKEYDHPRRFIVANACARVLRECTARDLLPSSAQSAESAVAQ